MSTDEGIEANEEGGADPRNRHRESRERGAKGERNRFLLFLSRFAEVGRQDTCMLMLQECKA